MIVQTHGLLELFQDILAKADTATSSAMESLTAGMERVVDNGRTRLSAFHELWLALALDSGLDWILNFAAVMQRESGEDWVYGSMGGNADARLTSAAFTVLALFHVTRHDVSLQEPDYLDRVVRFMTCHMDPRLMFFTTSPRRLQVGPSIAGSVLVPTVSDRSWVALPVAVAHLPSRYERAWIAEPLQPSGPCQAAFRFSHQTLQTPESEEPIGVQAGNSRRWSVFTGSNCYPKDF